MNPKAKTDTDAAIAAKIRETRMLRGISQEKLAEACGVTSQQLQKYESCTNRVSASRLIQIANALRVNPSHFFGEDSARSFQMDSPTRDVIAMMMDAPPETRSVIRDAVRTMIHATDELRNAIAGMKAAA